MDFTEEENIESKQSKKNKKKEEGVQPELPNIPESPKPPKKEEGSEVSIGNFLSNSELVRKYNPYLKKSFEHVCKGNKVHFNTIPEWEKLFKEFA